MRVAMRNSFGQGEWVCEEWTFQGMHQGPFIGPGGKTVPATHKRVCVTECIVLRVREGSIRKITVYFDRREVLVALGLAPPSLS